MGRMIRGQTGIAERVKRCRRNCTKKRLPVFLGEDAFIVKHAGGKGLGVFAVRPISKGSWLLRYKGTLLTAREARSVSSDHDRRGIVMGYQFFFRHADKSMCIDATDSQHISKRMNHSRLHPNAQPRLLTGTQKQPIIAFMATEDIQEGKEILFDYGERNARVIEANPWLRE